jgi:SnoaL-like polyketide cyclase
MNETDAPRNPTTQAREAIEIVCSGDLGRLGEYYSPNFVDHVNDAVHLGHDGIYESAKLYYGIFDDFRFEVEEQVSEGNRVASRWALHGTCRKRKIVLRGMTLSHVDESGHVIEDRGFTDTFSLLRELGVFRTLLLGLKVLTGRVKVPKGERATADAQPSRS